MLLTVSDDCDMSVPSNINLNMNGPQSGPVQVKLLCGADLLESFATPGLWKEDDVKTI